MLSVDLELRLRDFPLRVEAQSEAQSLGVYGRSGSGKTSLMDAICGLNEARGQLRLGTRTWLDSNRGLSIPPHLRGIGYVPQGGALFPDRSVWGNLLSGRKRCRDNGLPFERLVSQVVSTLELTTLLDAHPSQLSGGESQRVALGRALCSGAQLLILDEPTAALGAEFRRKVLMFLLRVRAEFQTPMLVVSHDPLDLQVLCDETLVMRRGRVVDQGTPNDVLARANAPGESISSVLAGCVEQSSAHLTCVRLDAATEQKFFVAGPSARPGQRVLINIDASQVLISKTPLDGISALNVLPTRVVGLEVSGHHHLVSLQLDTAHGDSPPQLTACLTHEARQRLDLRNGNRVYAVIKAASVWALAAGPTPPWASAHL